MEEHLRAGDGPEDLLILVDDNDEIVGYDSKDTCHEGCGILHRAFSIFIFNENAEFLLQKRSAEKLLWPGFWSNSVCSHPRKGETYEGAASRRLLEEVGLEADLQYLFKFSYQAAYGNVGSENEMCVVFAGFSKGPVKANSAEIEEWRFIDSMELSNELEDHPHVFTPWFRTEWKRFTDLDLLSRSKDGWKHSL